MHPFLPGGEQLRIGEALAGLGKEDILVIGSGVTVHNFGEIRWGRSEPEPLHGFLTDRPWRASPGAQLLVRDDSPPHGYTIWKKGKAEPPCGVLALLRR